jgi:HlyD family type I secretion membrane fusion protein
MPRSLDRTLVAPEPLPPAPAPLLLRRPTARHVLSVQELEDCPPPRSARAAVLLGAVMVAGFLAWAMHFPVTQRAMGSGEVLPQGFVQPVQHPDGGKVAELLVRAGDSVAEGQPLLRIDATLVTAEAEAARAREAALSLAATRLAAAAEGRLASLGTAPAGALAAIHDSQAAMAEAGARLRETQLAVLDAEIASREASVHNLAGLLIPTTEARNLARAEVSVMATMLERGLARRSEVFSLRQAHLRSEGDVERGLADLSAARLGVAETRARRDELAARARSEALGELVRVEADLAEARQARARAEGRLDRLTLLAPVAGLVKEVAPRGTGAVVEPGGLVAEIVPQGGGIQVALELPADQVGGVHPGQPARVKVLTYDPARFGSIAGRVEQVSAASFRRQDGSAYFRVQVALEAEHVGDARLGLRVSPGMTVAVEIATGQVSLLAWLAKPVRNALDQAFAER